jgi:hypothetical protein
VDGTKVSESVMLERRRSSGVKSQDLKVGASRVLLPLGNTKVRFIGIHSGRSNSHDPSSTKYQTGRNVIYVCAYLVILLSMAKVSVPAPLL